MTRFRILNATEILLLGLMLFLTACAPNFAVEKVYVEPSAKPADNAAPVAVLNEFRFAGSDQQRMYGSGTGALRESAVNALYRSGRFSRILTPAQASAEPPPADAAYVTLSISGKFEQDFKPYWWYLGCITPLTVAWPLMPRQGSILVSMDGDVERNGTTIHRFHFEEKEYFDMTWYGPYQIWNLQDQLDNMYVKVFARLSQQLRDNIPVGGDGVVSDAGSGSVRRKSWAMLELSGDGLLDSELRTLTAKLRAELVSMGDFAVMERDRITEILQEQGFQQSGCTSDECMVQVGRLVGVDRMLAGSVGRVGNTWLLTAREIDVETGRILREVAQEESGSIDGLLTDGIPALARKIASP